jgi:hypothetical protein
VLNRCWLATKSVEAFRICFASGAMPGGSAWAANDIKASAAIVQHCVKAVVECLREVDFMDALLYRSEGRATVRLVRDSGARSRT